MNAKTFSPSPQIEVGCIVKVKGARSGSAFKKVTSIHKTSFTWNRVNRRVFLGKNVYGNPVIRLTNDIKKQYDERLDEDMSVSGITMLSKITHVYNPETNLWEKYHV